MNSKHYYINKLYKEDIKTIKKLVKPPLEVQTCLQEPVSGFHNWLINLPI